jgi:hypothetical protein
MTPAVALAALALNAAQPDPEAQPPSAPAGAPAPPTIDSLLDQAPISEDARQAAVRSAFDAAEARRGDLDGRWRLEAGDGRILYIFQLSDPGQVADPRSITPHVPVIEGAWRDPGRAGAAGGSGFLASVQRDGTALTIRFSDRDPARSQVVRLHLKPDGDWAGGIEGEAASQPLVMKRF